MGSQTTSGRDPINSSTHVADSSSLTAILEKFFNSGFIIALSSLLQGFPIDDAKAYFFFYHPQNQESM